MARRPPPKPPIVETRRRGSAPPPSAPRTASPDRRIKVWRDDLPALQPVLPPDQAEDVLLRAEIEVHNARLRLANDPSVIEQAATKLALVDQVQRQATSIIPQDHANLGPGHFIAARDRTANAILGKALRQLLPTTTHVRNKPQDFRSPSSLARHVRNLKDSGDQN